MRINIKRLDDTKINHIIFLLLCGLMFSLPIGTSPSAIMGLTLMFVWIISGEFYRHRRLYLAEPLCWPVLSIIAIHWIALIYTPDLYGMGLEFAKKTYYWIYAFILSCIMIPEDRVEYIIKAFLFGLCINAIVGFLQFVGLFPTNDNNFYTGFPGGYSSLALFLNLGIVVSSYFFKKSENKRLKVLYIFLLAIYCGHLSIIDSRSGYITFAILSPLVAYNLVRRRGTIAVILINILLLLALILSPIVQKRIKRTIEDIRIQMELDKDLKWGNRYTGKGVEQQIDRIFMWRKAIELFLDHPIMGVGTGGYKKSIILHGGQRGMAHPHNNILYMAVSFGVIGIILFIWFFWIFYKKVWGYKKTPLGYFILMYGIIFIIAGMLDTTIINADSAYLLSIATGLTHSLGTSYKSVLN